MSHPLERLHPAFDRFREAHWYLHVMEEHYHFADRFRWSLNSFMRTLKEVPQQVQMVLQNDTGFPDWFRDRREQLATDRLVSYLFKTRDLVVHRGMLVPRSQAMIGITEGRGMKLGISFPLDPLEDSDAGMARYLYILKKDGDILELLKPDDDSLPCVHRQWRLEMFPDSEILGLCSTAAIEVGQMIRDVVTWLGHEPPDVSMNCRHSDQQVQYKTYPRRELLMRLSEASDGGAEHHGA